MKKILFFLLFVNIIFIFDVRSNESISNVVVDGSYYDWNVYYMDDLSGNKKCYIVSFAKKTIGNYKKDRKPYLMIAYFKAREVEEVSVFADYNYKLKSSIYVGVDNKQFRMFTKDKFAWTKSVNDDKMLITEILKAKEIKIRGETVNGEYTVDTFSTNGLTRAYKRMIELCED